jgi:hypothetical protein
MEGYKTYSLPLFARLSLQAGQKGGSLYGILQVKTVIFKVPRHCIRREKEAS